MGCKRKFNSEELLVSLVVVDNNSGTVVECTELVMYIEAVDSEVWNIGVPYFANIWVTGIGSSDFGLLSSFCSHGQCV
ncbi:hypothetical protein G9A89_007368 [Geosiphon pyriformis]|nr:hypothetical protein G9A89_007368 [Geosiphon pyriformis]